MDWPFTTDGCSGGMTWAWRVIARRDPPWEGACVKHDRAYWAGGSALQRRSADRLLMERVTRSGHPIIAFVMWCAVRVGGHPLLPLSWRWGYGWKFPRGYQ
jgi:hypothetical protein